MIQDSIRDLTLSLNADFFGEEWLGRTIDSNSIKELKQLADEKNIDVSSEDGQGYHSTIVDAPFFKDSLVVSKFKKKTKKEKAKNWKRNWLYMDIKEAFLKPKEAPKGLVT